MQHELFQQVGDLKISYKVFGALPSDRVVVLLHGWGANKELFDRAAQEISHRTGAAVITTDLPGFGRSSTPAEVWGTYDFAECFKHFLDSIGVGQITLLGGHSHGGRVAIRFTHDNPARVQKLALIDSAGIPPRHTLRTKLRIRLFKLIKKLIFVALPDGPLRQKVLSKAYSLFGSTDYQQAGAMRQTLVRVINEDLSPLLPKITQPTLLLWGEKDLDTPVWMAKEIERLLPDAGLVIWEGAGHYSFIDRPQEFSIVTAKFLTG